MKKENFLITRENFNKELGRIVKAVKWKTEQQSNKLKSFALLLEKNPEQFLTIDGKEGLIKFAFISGMGKKNPCDYVHLAINGKTIFKINLFMATTQGALRCLVETLEDMGRKWEEFLNKEELENGKQAS